MEENNNEEYISLIEASKLCDYSEPYLRLRSRQGKLKSIKFGKKWMTKTTWVKDYVERARAWNEKMEQKKQIVVQEENLERDPLPLLPEKEITEKNLELPKLIPPPKEDRFENKPEVPAWEKEKLNKEKEAIKHNREFMHNFSTLQGDYALILATGTLFAIMFFFGVALEKQLIFQDFNQISVNQAIMKASVNEPIKTVSQKHTGESGETSFICTAKLPCGEEKDNTQEKSLLVKIVLEAADFINRHPFPW